MDFSQLVENELLNCINADCVGFIIGDYRVNLSFNDENQVVLRRGKLTQPFLPKLTNKDDGAI